MKIVAIDVPELGNRSYLVHDGKLAIVIDPSRRIQQFIDLASSEGVRIKAVFETHVHNDYVTGGYALAQKLSVPYYVSADDKVEFKRDKIKNEQTVTVGLLRITALSSPGHTSHHLSYLIEENGQTPALFSGGSLLYGAVGRPDLESAQATPRLARAQYQTAQFFVDRLDPLTTLYPTHGFGSFCAAAETQHVSLSTIKQQIRRNNVYTAKDETSFVDDLLSNLDVHPSYYSYMAPANLKGPLGPNLELPRLLTREALLREIHSGAAVIDMRSRLAYAAEHMSGTYNIELSNDLATYVGWLLSWDTPLILIASDAEEVATAQEQLSLIGIEVLEGQMRTSELLRASQTKSYPVRNFIELEKSLPDDKIAILDVRRDTEWRKGHIPGAVHIPLHELINRLPEIDQTKQIWVHCASGFRASIAASIINSRGRKVMLINDSYSNAEKTTLIPIKKKKYVREVKTGRAQLLDVRDKSEWKAGHAKGATHVPLGRLLDGDASNLSVDRPVYVYCESGIRSGMAEHYLNAAGFKAVNIGGLTDWTHAGGSIEY